ncbi:MAG TPA: hypothetical protein VLK84_05465, partial [Longimicrobium sp.]|nr:hypothetical protein [Longimicrobium sp.]
MSQFDVAVGMNADTLGQGMTQLYAKPDARTKLFKGSLPGTLSGQSYVASWDIQAAPTFTLQPPPSDQWAASIDPTGKHPTDAAPTQNAFQLVFPTFYGQYTLGTSTVSGTTKVIVFATASVSGSTLVITPKSIWLDESQMGGWDKAILNVILKQVLVQAAKLLQGIQIPPLTFSVVSGT